MNLFLLLCNFSFWVLINCNSCQISFTSNNPYAGSPPLVTDSRICEPNEVCNGCDYEYVFKNIHLKFKFKEISPGLFEVSKAEKFVSKYEIILNFH